MLDIFDILVQRLQLSILLVSLKDQQYSASVLGLSPSPPSSSSDAQGEQKSNKPEDSLFVPFTHPSPPTGPPPEVRVPPSAPSHTGSKIPSFAPSPGTRNPAQTDGAPSCEVTNTETDTRNSSYQQAPPTSTGDPPTSTGNPPTNTEAPPTSEGTPPTGAPPIITKTLLTGTKAPPFDMLTPPTQSTLPGHASPNYVGLSLAEDLMHTLVLNLGYHAVRFFTISQLSLMGMV